jgi:hypothetical protein
MPLTTKSPRYIPDADIRDLNRRAGSLREVDKSLSDAVTDLLDDVERTRERLLMLLPDHVDPTDAQLAMREAAQVDHDIYVSRAYDLCAQLLDDAEEAEEKADAEREADERNDAYQMAVGQ